MGQFQKYAKPPRGDLIEAGLTGGQPMPGDVDYYEPDMEQFMGGNLPSVDTYGQPKQQWNAEMMDRLIDTRVVCKDKDGNILEKPKLWLFETDAFRHFQLSNLRSRDQTEMERDIADIQMLAHQDGNEQMCEEMQVRVYAKLSMFKSRSDLPIQHRERDAWFTNVSELKTHEIKRPQGSGGFFSDLLGGKKRRDY